MSSLQGFSALAEHWVRDEYTWVIICERLNCESIRLPHYVAHHWLSLRVVLSIVEGIEPSSVSHLSQSPFLGSLTESEWLAENEEVHQGE